MSTSVTRVRFIAAALVVLAPWALGALWPTADFARAEGWTAPAFPAVEGIRVFEPSSALSFGRADWKTELRGVDMQIADIHIETCADYLTLLDHPKLLATVSMWVMHNAYVECTANALMQKAAPAERSYFSVTDPARDVVERLDFDGIYWRLALPFESFADFPELSVQSSPPLIEATIPDGYVEGDIHWYEWSYTFEFLAGADWTADGVEDLLVILSDSYMGFGRNHEFTVWVLVTDGPDAPIRGLYGLSLLERLSREP